jgi:hypothetical protein
VKVVWSIEQTAGRPRKQEQMLVTRDPMNSEEACTGALDNSGG